MSEEIGNKILKNTMLFLLKINIYNINRDFYFILIYFFSIFIFEKNEI